jgi:hypothetical protein
MTMTDERQDTGILRYGENPEQEGVAAPHPTEGGSIEQVAVARDPRSDKEACSVCSKLITKKNMKQHRRNQHGLYERSKRKDAEAQPPKQYKPRAAKLSADEIVLVVVQMKWPNGVPVNKIEALLKWQRDTERFLNE